MNIFEMVFGRKPKCINQAQTAIANYHNVVLPSIKAKCQRSIIDAMNTHPDWTIGELAAKLGMDKSSVSARRYEMIAEGLVTRGHNRPCRISGKVCQTVRRP